MWCLANPKLGERDVMTAMLEVDHHLVGEGEVILADKGFASGEFEQLGVHLVRPAWRGSSDPSSSPAERRLLRMRQWIEAVFDTLKGQLSLERHGAGPTTASSPGSASAGHGRRVLAQHQDWRPQRTLTDRQ